MEHILIDIETVPCQRVIDNTRLLTMARQQVLDKVYNPKWKPETQEAARAKDLAAVELQTVDKMSLKPGQAQVCAIVAQHWDGKVSVGSAGKDERTLLAELAVFLHPFYESQIKFVGFNIRDFDIPVLAAAYMRNRLKIPPAIRLAMFNPYNNVDLFKMFPNCGKMQVFGEVLFLEVEDPHSGKDVAELASQGQWEAILAHCEADVEQLDAMFNLIMI